jgi:hypothetical protein
MTTADLDGPGKSDGTLAIDLGTSGPKVALVSVQGEVLACEIETTPVMLLPGGGAEQAPNDWWKSHLHSNPAPAHPARSRKPHHRGPVLHHPVVRHGGGGPRWTPIGQRRHLDGCPRRTVCETHHLRSGAPGGVRHRQTMEVDPPDRRHSRVLPAKTPSPTFSFSSMKNRKSMPPPINSWSPRTTSISN